MAATFSANDLDALHAPRGILETFNSARKTSMSITKGEGAYPSANAGHPHPESNFEELL
jgi:hypothetical protein